MSEPTIKSDVVEKARAINQANRRAPATSSYLAAATKGLDGVQPVVVVDVHMRFGSMVMFMIKWAIASIPAFLILLVIGWIVARLFGGLLLAIS
ncbi:hypothetical protein NA655_08590 [Pseudomonas kuykendallii]|uniref:Uncharacterized protein n=1 Tax=Pseudomonas kuykendallii TaxID=1007099 RepID=A0A1H3EJH0_9PSED|nr:hypothetical protein [Pseudomonas kuykendallii]MCQ4271077.1 hypothetical protein [Pseudomonas kuykendallii]SDX78737.1 hypothetical protein SAMN05216287_3745 [Pseudomonas kuykendallii]